MRSRSTNNQSRTPQKMVNALAGAATSANNCFGKSPECPSSEDLLQLCGERHTMCEPGLLPARRAAMQRHLAACDFCAAEAQLLAAHAPQLAEPHPRTPVQMPVHLYALARALLTRPPQPDTPLADILRAPVAPQLADAV